MNTEKSKSNILTYAGIFGLFLLIGFAIVFIYFPIIRTNAYDISRVRVRATVGSVISLTLDTDELDFSFPAPTSNGVFDSGSIVAEVTTNSVHGYELYFSSIDNETDMTHSVYSVNDVIASDFDGTVTSSTMGANKWGYSLDDTNYSKIPALNSQATVRNIDHFPSSESERSSTIYIGAKVDLNLPTGVYSKDVIFSTVTHDLVSNAMQTFNKSSLVVGESTTLQDTRDGNTYTVKKLEDGNVWMTQNLRIVDQEISSMNSNLPVGETYYIPASSLSGFSEYDTDYVYVEDPGYGGYYSFYTATAGWGIKGQTGTNSPKDICPKTWRMPTRAEYQTIRGLYSAIELYEGDPSFDRSGYIYDNRNAIVNKNSLGYYWTSTSLSNNNGINASEFYITNTPSSSIIDANKYRGLSIRCIAQ